MFPGSARWMIYANATEQTITEPRLCGRLRLNHSLLRQITLINLQNLLDGTDPRGK